MYTSYRPLLDALQAPGADAVALEEAAEEAERSGLVSRIVPAADLIEEAVKTAATIASMAPLAVLANKEMVNAAFETGLAMGVQFERRLFHGMFGTEDQQEGMAAVVEKQPGQWTGH